MSHRRFAAVLHPDRVVLLLGGAVAVLVLGHAFFFGLRAIMDFNPDHYLYRLFRFFNMGSEANLPTYVSALNVLLAGGLLSLIAWHKASTGDRFSRHWWVLAAGILFMSVDEATQIHEGVIGPLVAQTRSPGEGGWHYTWYMVFIPMVVLIGLAYIPFFRHLPRWYAVRFIAAGGVFISGAIGVEVLEAYLSDQIARGMSGGLMGLSVLIEETCEMLGIVLLIHTLLCYVAESGLSLDVRVAPGAPVVQQPVTNADAPAAELESAAKP